MTHAAAHDHWVSMDVPLHGDISFETGSLAQQLAPRSSARRGAALRVVSPADRLTKEVMGFLEHIADRLVARQAHTRSRRLFESLWQAHSAPSLFFVYEGGRTLRPVSAEDAEATARAWADLSNLRNDLAHTHVLVEFLRDTREQSAEHMWNELRQTLDVALTPELPPPVHTSVSEPNVIIQTDPAEARRATLLAQGWPTSTEAGVRAGKASSNPGQWAKDARDAGRLLGVWDESRRTFIHPDFQFAPDGSLLPEMRDLLTAMATHPEWTAETNANGWRRAYWLYQPFRSLSRRTLKFAAAHPPGQGNALHDSPDGALAMVDEWLDHGAPEDSLARTPAEVFAENPQAVITLARQTAAAARPDTDVEGQPNGE